MALSSAWLSVQMVTSDVPLGKIQSNAMFMASRSSSNGDAKARPLMLAEWMTSSAPRSPLMTTKPVPPSLKPSRADPSVYITGLLWSKNDV